MSSGQSITWTRSEGRICWFLTAKEPLSTAAKQGKEEDKLRTTIPGMIEILKERTKSKPEHGRLTWVQRRAYFPTEYDLIRMQKCGVTKGRDCSNLDYGWFSHYAKFAFSTGLHVSCLLGCVSQQNSTIDYPVKYLASCPQVAARRALEWATCPTGHAKSLADEAPDTLLFTPEDDHHVGEDCRGQIPSPAAVSRTVRVYHAEDSHPHPSSLHLAVVFGHLSWPLTRSDMPVTFTMYKYWCTSLSTTS